MHIKRCFILFNQASLNWLSLGMLVLISALLQVFNLQVFTVCSVLLPDSRF
jgi:hypothetical protein